MKSKLAGTGMNARELGIICALLAAMPNLGAVRVRGVRTTINSRNRSSERRNVGKRPCAVARCAILSVESTGSIRQ